MSISVSMTFPSRAIEIKRLKARRSNAELKNSSRSALDQIKQKNYYDEALKDKCKRILLYGMAFSEKNIVSSFEEKKPE